MQYNIGGDYIVAPDAISMSTDVCSFSQLLNLVSSVDIPNSSIGSVEVGKQCGTNETSHGQYIRRLPKNSKTPSQRLRDAKRLFSQQCRPSRCGYNIFNCKWLIFPICLHSHWLAFTINLTEHKIEILDSLFDKMLPGLDKIIDGVLIILEELSKDFGGVIFDHKMYSADIIPLAKVVKQTNTWDCGVLLIKIMESWYGKMTTEINKDMTDKYRLEIASSIILSQHNEIKDEIIKKATESTTNL